MEPRRISIERVDPPEGDTRTEKITLAELNEEGEQISRRSLLITHDEAMILFGTLGAHMDIQFTATIETAARWQASARLILSRIEINGESALAVVERAALIANGETPTGPVS